MRNFRKAALSAALCALTSFVVISCSRAEVKGVVCGASEGSVLVLKQSNSLNVIDSVSLSSDGKFRFDIKMKKDQRDFYYLYMGQRKLSSLLLSPGESVELECDTTGFWKVQGSEECANLRANELALVALNSCKPLKYKDYVSHYRNMVKYVTANMHSLTCVPVFFQKVGDVPVFGQATDGVLMQSVADSLSLSYPGSPYVDMLRKEADKRLDVMRLNSMLDKAAVVSFPEVNLPDQSGTDCKLTELADRGPVLLVFWNASQLSDKLFNQDILKPLYDEYSPSGLSVYQVGVLTDKAPWTLAVRQQGMPWTNVYDGSASSAAMYGVEKFPSVFLIVDGEVTAAEEPTMDGLRKALKKCFSK